MIENPNQNKSNSGAYVGATILIVIGVIALLANLGKSEVVGSVIPLAIGIAFLTAYALTRQYGFLVPGGILTGIGSGITFAEVLGVKDNGPYVVLAGGLGFLLIYALDMLVTRTSERWWPVIPGGIMLAVGTGMSAENEGLIKNAALWSPVLLILLGVFILLTQRRSIKH